MTREELKEARLAYLNRYYPYKRKFFSKFNYEKVLSNIMYVSRAGQGEHDRYNDVIIMIDTETSKKRALTYKYDKHGNKIPDAYHNHVVAWTITIRAFNRNIVTLWGMKPSDLCETIVRIHDCMQGDKTIFFCHNLPYDWVFIRKFLFIACNGFPTKQLNVKPHYPIMIEFPNGIILRDTLILAQRSLEKWANDLDVEHKKAVGKWDYDKLRTQKEHYSSDELEYIEHDTLAGVECIQKTMDALHKHIYSLPYTATGIPREEVRKRGKEHHAHDAFLRKVPTFEQQAKLEMIFHGGYTHGNRDLINMTIDWDMIRARDFSSSYPYCMLAFMYPNEAFAPISSCKIDYICRNANNHAFIFKLILFEPELKNHNWPMPVLQMSKCVCAVNPIIDNGRILKADYVEIYLNEIDLLLIREQYNYRNNSICVEVETAKKAYLPRWFTDYVYECYKDKCMLKHGDPVLYSIAKAKLNALYGMTVQKPIKEEIIEEYIKGDKYKNGDYHLKELEEDEKRDEKLREIYQKYVNRKTTVLPYFVGVWVTSYAMFNLFQLGKCCDTWIYSDTDSCYAIGWHEEEVNAYNKECINKLAANGYGAVLLDGNSFIPGVAEPDSVYSEFRVMGAKRYCGRSEEDKQLHITVAGVPKRGAVQLNDDIENFRPGMIFSGDVTGKNMHTYFYLDDIYTDEAGNETGDSIDLSPCDYLLDAIEHVDIDDLETEEVEIAFYDEE